MQQHGADGDQGSRDEREHPQDEPGDVAARLVCRLGDAESIDEGRRKGFQKRHESMVRRGRGGFWRQMHPRGLWDIEQQTGRVKRRLL